jgi:hypothetical protein
MSRKQPGGHPAKQDPAVDKLFRTMKATVELVRDLQDRLPAEEWLCLRAAALGQMVAYSNLTGLPAPVEIMNRVPDAPLSLAALQA